jgi:hypothetical protein
MLIYTYLRSRVRFKMFFFVYFIYFSDIWNLINDSIVAILSYREDFRLPNFLLVSYHF